MADGRRAPYSSCQLCEFGYCAPSRCYCGHKECSAFASYVTQPAPRATTAAPKTSPHAQTWANREEPTWIDQL